ncbi:hypothetical protein BBOV_III011890 [Babesia bovis T2Bo]|uniref:hypothetical protein n=1 Tax=Babesia bovis T2Bo TaxID=484906 RepID=UPI001C34C261|nr:hypothetical protein BBOV_III011890 [Babesia bovis T2Bo]EDO08741.2 hypothetical protein BBOV_III011890 [Babesia bovis T2Bo]
MPWQQSSIFNQWSNDYRSNYNYTLQSEDTITSNQYDDSNPSSQPKKIFIHNIFQTTELPKWNPNLYIKALQNSTYIPKDIADKLPNYESKLKQIIKMVAQNITTINNYELARTIFACSKGKLLQNQYATISFIKLLENEVLQRLDTMHIIELYRILHSVTNINADAANYPESALNETTCVQMPFDADMVKCIIYRIVDRITNIGAMDIANLICLVAYNGMIDSNITLKINKGVKRRLWGLTEPIKILTPVIALAMFGMLQVETAASSLKALQSCSTLPRYSVNFTEATECKSMIRIINEHIFPMKLLEVILRIDYPELYKGFDAESIAYLNQIRYIKPLLISYKDWDYLRPLTQAWEPYMYADSQYNILPHIHGPYVIRMCDPIKKIIIQPTIEWQNVSSWQKFYIKHYQSMMNRHLEKSGFNIQSEHKT